MRPCSRASSRAIGTEAAGIAVALDVHEHFFRWDAKALRNRVDNSLVSLMADHQVDIVGLTPARAATWRQTSSMLLTAILNSSGPFILMASSESRAHLRIECAADSSPGRREGHMLSRRRSTLPARRGRRVRRPSLRSGAVPNRTAVLGRSNRQRSKASAPMTTPSENRRLAW